MRHNSTDRIGIYSIGKIIESNIGWIFREQPIVDVGIDALIEQSINGEPTGKFLALQIKSGDKNFYFHKNKFTYYISLTHYHYWLNLNLPIILVIYLPKNDEVLWEEISKKTLKESKLRWKIDIPSSKKLDKNSLTELNSIISSRNNYKTKYLKSIDEISDESLNDTIEKIKNIKYSQTSITKLSDILTELRAEIVESNNRLAEFKILNYNDSFPEVISVLKNISRIMDIAAKRLINEIDIFASTSANGFIALDELNTMYYSLTFNREIISDYILLIEKLLPSYDYAISGMTAMMDGVKKISEKYKFLKQSKDNFILTNQIIIEELELSKSLVNSSLSKYRNY